MDESNDPRVYFAAERTLLVWVLTGNERFRILWPDLITGLECPLAVRSKSLVRATIAIRRVSPVEYT